MLNSICFSLNTTLITDPNHWNSIIKKQARLKNDRAILSTFSQMEALSIPPDSRTLPLILKACSYLRAIEIAKRINSNIQGEDLFDDVRVRSALVDFYGKCGFLEDARQVFDETPERDVVLWNVMMNSYVRHCCYKEALLLFKQIWAENLKLSSATLVTLIVACGELLDLGLGREIHGFCLRNGFLDLDSYVGTALIGFYSKFDVGSSRRVFDAMDVRNVVSWNAMIDGYSSFRDQTRALELFVEMLAEGSLECDNVTMLLAIQACSELGSLELGMQLHQLAFKFGYAHDLHIINALLNLYGKTCCLESSSRLFESAPMGDVALWNSMISLYFEYQLYDKAWRLFARMQSEGLHVTEATMTILLSMSSETGIQSGVGKSLHAKVIKSGLNHNTSVANGVLRMYSELGYIQDATMVFGELSNPDVISWNIIISAFACHGLRTRAWNYFMQMLLNSETNPNSHTIVAILAVCKGEFCINIGRSLHGYVTKRGIEVTRELSTALVEMYMDCGDEPTARDLFERCSNRDVISWNSLIASYVRNNTSHEALPLLKQMISEVEPNYVTVVNILSSCTDMANLTIGQCLHCYALRREYFTGFFNLSVANAILSMYARCGSIESAVSIFKTMETRNVSSWNALIAGYGLNGMIDDALRAFSQMLEAGFRPNGRTLLSLLSACNYSGTVEQGLQLFKSITRDFNVNPLPVHYNCLVDLLGRAGYIEEAKTVVDSMPFEPDASVLRALMSACRAHSELGLARSIFQKLLELEPLNPGNYVLLSNIYAAAGLWSDVRDLRTHLKRKGLKKKPGLSWIFVRNQVHCFIAGDQSFFEHSAKTHETLKSLMFAMRDEGYTPDYRWVMHEEYDETRLRFEQDSLEHQHLRMLSV